MEFLQGVFGLLGIFLLCGVALLCGLACDYGVTALLYPAFCKVNHWLRRDVD